MSLVVASCGGSSNSSDKIAQLEDSIARMQTRIENQGTNDLENQETNNNTSNDANGIDSETEASANDKLSMLLIMYGLLRWRQMKQQLFLKKEGTLHTMAHGVILVRIMG